MIEAIKKEIEQLRKLLKEPDAACFQEAYLIGGEDTLNSISSFIESLEKEPEHKSLGEDMNIVFSAISKVCNTLKPEEFARYNETVYKVAMMAVAMAKNESLGKEQFADETMMEKDKIDTGFTKFMEKGVEVTDFCKPVPEEIAKVLPDVVTECLFGDDQEQPQGLDEAAEDSLDSYADNIVEWEDKNPQWDKDTIRATAYRFYTLGKEAGAKWQLAKLKETCDIIDREYLKAAMEAEYERGKKEMAEQGGTAETCKESLHISETCKENANSFTDLDEAAKEYARQYTENDNGNGGDDWEDDIRITFEAGAKWMAERGWHEEAIIKGSNDVVWLNYNVELPIDLAKYFKDGDKVIVQIRKAD